MLFRYYLPVLFFFALIGLSKGFTAKWKVLKPSECRIPNKFQLNVAQPTESEEKKVSLPAPVNTMEYFTPPYANGVIIAATLLGQAFLVSFAFMSAYIYTLITGKEVGTVQMGFNIESMKTALSFAVPLVVTWLAFENLPFKNVEAIIRDARFYALRLLGRNTSAFQALLLCAILAGKVIVSKISTQLRFE